MHLPKMVLPHLSNYALKDLAKMVQDAANRVLPAQWGITIAACVITFVLSNIGNWIVGRSNDSNTIAQMSANVARMQSDISELQSNLKRYEDDADKHFVRQDRFEEFTKAYDTNHADAIAYRAATDSKLEQILEMLSARSHR
jgi:hypothetical protein